MLAHMTVQETIFSKILRGELPCHRIFEDEHVLAFLDINPLSEGHTLVIPKQAVATVDALDDDHAAALGRALPRICRAVMQATGTTDYNILQNNGAAAGQVVFHVHFHIIPRFSNRNAATGLRVHWQPTTLTSDQGQALAQRIVSVLSTKS